MYPFGRAFGVNRASPEASLMRRLTTSRVLKAYSIDEPDEVAWPPWVHPAIGLLTLLVTVALGLHAWLYILAPLSRDEAALATYLALLVTVSWVSAIGLISAIALLAVRWVSRVRRTRTGTLRLSCEEEKAAAATRSEARAR